MSKMDPNDPIDAELYERSRRDPFFSAATNQIRQGAPREEVLAKLAFELADARAHLLAEILSHTERCPGILKLGP